MVKIHGESLGLPTFGSVKMFFATKFLRQFCATFPFHQHGASFIANQPAGFGSGGKIEFGGHFEHLVCGGLFRAGQLVKLGKVLLINFRLATSSVNRGVPYVASGLVANSNNAIVGSQTTGPELVFITRALGV